MWNGVKIVHIVACGLNGEIGKDNQLLWSIREDMEFFKNNTVGNVLLMGRKTFESLPSKLKNRVTYCISSGSSDECCSLNEGLSFSHNMTRNFLNTDSVIVAGGGQLYKATENIVDEVILTIVEKEFDADTYYKLPDGFAISESNLIDKKLCIDRKTGEELEVSFYRIVK